MQQILKRKALIIGVGVILISTILFFVLNESSNTIPTPTSTPSPTAVTETEPQVVEQSPIPPDKEIEGQIIVGFKEEYSDAQINERLKQYNAEIIGEIGGINKKILRVPVGQEDEILERLGSDPYVESAVQDTSNHLMYRPNDSLYINQYGLKNTGQAILNAAGTANADIKAEAAWDVTKGNGIKVAVLDTGANLNHPELVGKIVASRSFVSGSATAEDNNGHGTHVAGTVTAVTNNGSGIAGTCPECVLLIGKVMGDNGTGPTSGIASGITWAADQGAKVINLSLGTSNQSSASIYQQAIDYAISKGAVVVVAAGNCGGTNFSQNGCTSQNQMTYPGGTNGVVTVAATDNLDQKASFSNHGAHVEVAAPGKNILSTGPNHAFAKQPSGYNFAAPFYYTSGTSMASPMVAGVVGLIWSSQYGTSSQAVINRLYTNTDKIQGTGTFWSKGRVNAAKAVGAAAVTAAITPTVVSPTFVCAGSSTGTVCPPTPTGGANITLVPTGSGNGSPAPSAAATIPVGGVNPTTGVGNPNPGSNPCSDNTSIMHNKKHKKDKGGWIEKFIKFILKFFEQFLKLIGIQIPGNPNPNPGQNPVPTQTPGTNPNPNPTPCPEPTSSQPTTQPSPSVEPTTGISLVPSAAPSQATAPTTAPGTAGEMPAITVSGNKIMRGGQPWWFVGYNSFVWSGDCGTNSEKMSAAQVDAWFDTMRTDGHGAVRIYFWQGWNISRLDQLIASAKKRNIYVTITVEEAMGYCGRAKVDDGWFNTQNKNSYKNHMSMLLNRYKGNTTIAWFEYFNEPGYHGGKLRSFYDEMGAHAATIDPTRLFSSGTVAPYWLGSEANFKNVHESPGVDIASLHEYDGGEVESNHGPKARASSAGKPVIVGEAGYQRMKPWEGCDSDVSGIVNRVKGKAQVYKTDGYAGVFFWAWQPGDNCGKGLHALPEVHSVLKTIN